MKSSAQPVPRLVHWDRSRLSRFREVEKHSAHNLRGPHIQLLLESLEPGQEMGCFRGADRPVRSPARARRTRTRAPDGVVPRARSAPILRCLTRTPEAPATVWYRRIG